MVKNKINYKEESRRKIMSKKEKPKRHTSYYYDYLQEVVPWLKSRLPKLDKAYVEKELWSAIQEATEGTHDATVYLSFEVLESYLSDDYITPGCADRIMALLKELTDESDSEGISVDISW